MNVRRFAPASIALSVAVGLTVASLPALAANSATGLHAVASGGDLNTASGDYSAIGGGESHTASGRWAAIAGGNDNTAEGDAAVVCGGASNTASGIYATVAGGLGNIAGYPISTIGGGENNTASGQFATVSGGLTNSAFGSSATIPGGQFNSAGANFTFAAGLNSHIRTGAEANSTSGDMGTFVWTDALGYSGTNERGTEFESSGPNQFLVRASGGFALNGTPVNARVAITARSTASNPGYASMLLQQGNSGNGMLITAGDASTEANTANDAAFYLDQYNGSSQTRRLSIDGTGKLTVTAQAYKPGGGSWAASSDGRLKRNVQPLDQALDRLLSLRGVTFEYAHPDAGMHPAGTFTGFIAQEVEPKFPNWIEHDAQGYLTVGPQGFEALTVEALRQMKHDVDKRVARLQTENTALRSQLAQQLKVQETTLAELRLQVAALSATTNTRMTAATVLSGNLAQ